MPQSAKPSNQLFERIGVGACVVATLLAIGLHITFLTHAGGLWRDEAASVQLASSADFGTQFRLASEFFPIFFFALERAWWVLGLGASDSSLRVLGLLVGLGLLAGVWLNAKLMGVRWPFMSLGLLAANLALVRWGDGLRAYGCGSLFILLMFGLVWRLVQKPGAYTFLAASLAAILSVQTLYHDAFLVLAVCLAGSAICGLRRQWTTAALVLGVGTLAAVSLLPYVPLLIRAQHGMALQKAGFEWDRVWATLAYALGSGLDWPVIGWLGLAPLVVGTGWMAVLGRGKASGISADDLPVFSAVTLLAGVGCFFGFMWLSAFPAQPWYYLPLMVLAAGAMDGALSSWSRQLRFAGPAFIVIMVCLPFPAVWKGAHARQTNVDLVATELQRRAKPGDLVLVNPFFLGITFERYFKGPQAWTTLPPIADQRFHRLDLLVQGLCSKPLLKSTLDRMTNTLASGHDLWLVGDWPPPQRAETAPPELPDPPSPGQPFGWAESRQFTYAWERQAVFLIGTHARHAAGVPVHPTVPISEVENVRLIQVTGWR